MADRLIYAPKQDEVGVVCKRINFKYYSGYAESQKLKTIDSLHSAAKKEGFDFILEVSTLSPLEIGRNLSAFNLKAETINRKKTFSVEQAFQASKVFEHGGPYADLLNVSSRDAKKDKRLKTSGKLIKFKFFDYEFDNEPKTFFYDWLYVNTLLKNERYFDEIVKFSAFTDICFNEKDSINCQAYSLALFVSFLKNNVDLTQLKEKDYFLETCKKEYNNRWRSEEKSQSLFGDL